MRCKGQGDDVRVRWTGVGQRGRNVAITNLAVRRNYFGSFDSQAFLSVVNFSDEAQTLSFTLHLDNDLIAEKSLTLEPQRAPGGGAALQPSRRRCGAGAAQRDGRPRSRQRRLCRDPAAARHRGAPGECGEPLPREGAQERPPGEARGPDAGRLPGRHGGLRRGRARRDEPAAHRQRALRPRQLRPRRRAHRGAGPARVAGHHGLGPDPSRSCGRSTSPRWPSRKRCGCARSRRARRSWRRWAARSSICSRSAIARRCSSASTSSGPTSRCAWPSR